MFLRVKCELNGLLFDSKQWKDICRIHLGLAAMRSEKQEPFFSTVSSLKKKIDGIFKVFFSFEDTSWCHSCKLHRQSVRKMYLLTEKPSLFGMEAFYYTITGVKGLLKQRAHFHGPESLLYFEAFFFSRKLRSFVSAQLSANFQGEKNLNWTRWAGWNSNSWCSEQTVHVRAGLVGIRACFIHERE